MNNNKLKKISKWAFDEFGNLKPFKQQLYEYKQKKIPTGTQLIITQDSKALAYANLKNYPIVINQSNINKIITEKHSNINHSIIENIDNELISSVLAFDSITINNAKIIVLNKIDKNKNPIIATIHEGKTNATIEINEITSIYDKKEFQSFLKRTIDNNKNI